tara:strand:+ start:2316 stop:3344 length:1029 start_codon:yes stop_codon:yes gene_type:complete
MKYLNTTIPVSWYCQSEKFEFEIEKIFLNSWQLVGPESKIPNIGDTIKLTITKQPIIITRIDMNRLKAYFNICRHRGGPIVSGNGCYKQFQCQYHGWIYTNEGKLKNARGFDNNEIKKSDFNLKEIKVSVWNGLIFINFNEKCNSLESIYEDLEKRINKKKFSSYQFYKRDSYDISCNWKIYMDNYLEGLHIPLVHPELNKTINYKSYKTEIHNQFLLQWCLIDQKLNPYKNDSSEDLIAYYITIFPNVILNIAPGRLQTNIVEPINEKNCLVHFDYYFKEMDEKQIQKDLNFSDIIQREDIKICESVQANYESKRFKNGIISKNDESGVFHFHSRLKEILL